MRKAPQIESRTICDETGHTLFVVKYTTPRGEVLQKTLSPEDYIKLIGGSLREECRYWRVRQDFLPEGFIDGAIGDESNYIIAFKVPGEVRFFAHTSGNYNIPYPDLIFVLQMKKGSIWKKLCFGLGKDGDTLYHYPFGNVSADGGICMGNIELDEIRSGGPATFAELFFLGKTNNDYVSHGCPVKGNLSQEMFLKKLDGKKKFPERLLVPCEGQLKRVADIKKMISAF